MFEPKSLMCVSKVLEMKKRLGQDRCLKTYDKKLPNILTNINLQIQEIQYTSNRINPKKTIPGHILVKAMNNKDE